MTTNLSTQAKTLMQSADALHDSICIKYGENSDAALYALQASLGSWLTFCEAERLEMGEVEKDT